jgi:hypothetical protein
MKRGGDGWRRRGEPHVLTRDAAQIAIDGHRAAVECDADPEDARQSAVRRGILRVGGNRLAKGGSGTITLEVVQLSCSADAERVRCGIGQGRPGRGDPCGRGADENSHQQPAHGPILREPRLRRLCLLHTIAPRFSGSIPSEGVGVG